MNLKARLDKNPMLKMILWIRDLDGFHPILSPSPFMAIMGCKGERTFKAILQEYEKARENVAGMVERLVADIID